MKEAFSQFVRQIRPGGFLIIKEGVDIVLDNPQITVYRYSYDVPCDFYARNVQLLEGGHYRYDIVVPGGAIEGCTLGIPGWSTSKIRWRPWPRYGARPGPKGLRWMRTPCAGRWRRSRA